MRSIGSNKTKSTKKSATWCTFSSTETIHDKPTSISTGWQWVASDDVSKQSPERSHSWNLMATRSWDDTSRLCPSIHSSAQLLSVFSILWEHPPSSTSSLQFEHSCRNSNCRPRNVYWFQQPFKWWQPLKGMRAADLSTDRTHDPVTGSQGREG